MSAKGRLPVADRRIYYYPDRSIRVFAQFWARFSCPALRVCILCASDTLPCLYFTRRLSWPASSEVPSPRLGDEEIISKKRETINNPAIAAPMIIYAPCFNCVSLRICLHVRFHAGIPSSHTSHRAKPVIPFAWWLSASLSHAQASAPVPADRH
jgi:hypothetical protein